jgi:hypothetical protein
LSLLQKCADAFDGFRRRADASDALGRVLYELICDGTVCDTPD